MKKLSSLVSSVCLLGVILTPVVNLAVVNARPAVAQTVDGRNVKEVRYGRDGIFQQQTDGSWLERNEQGRQFTFRETNRDQWSVYLLKEDGGRVQLDLWRKEVILNGSQVLYAIANSSSRISEAIVRNNPTRNNPSTSSVTVFNALQNPSSELCLDSFGRRGAAIMHSCHGQQGNQKWLFNNSTGELKNPSSGLCLDSFGRRGEAIMHPCHGQQGNQKWVSSSRVSPPTTPNRPPIASSRTIAEGIFKFPNRDPIYYSNGQGHYCWFDSWNNFISINRGNPGWTELDGRLSQYAMTYDGICTGTAVSRPAAHPDPNF